MRVLLLGGTADATRLARLLAGAGVKAVFSYAGRTLEPKPQPLPTRIGGFGGIAGLADYLSAEGITHVIDATHPFAAGMSRNAVAACAGAGVALAALERAPWAAEAGDDWTIVPDIAGAIAALPMEPARVFLAIGRQNIAAFAARPRHFYLLRTIDPPDAVPLPDHAAIIGRGPFTTGGDIALMRAHRITHLVAKNAGGEAARGKIEAARAVGLPVIMIARPALPDRKRVETAEAAMAWLAHEADLGV